MNALRCHFEESENVDIRYTRAYMEHRYLTWKRLEYISQSKSCDFSNWIEAYKLIYEKTNLIHNLGIKYNITGSKLSLNSILHLMTEINEYENNNINDIITELKMLQEKSV